jgi:hypothetical protein
MLAMINPQKTSKAGLLLVISPPDSEAIMWYYGQRDIDKTMDSLKGRLGGWGHPHTLVWSVPA